MAFLTAKYDPDFNQEYTDGMGPLSRKFSIWIAKLVTSYPTWFTDFGLPKNTTISYCSGGWGKKIVSTRPKKTKNDYHYHQRQSLVHENQWANR